MALEYFTEEELRALPQMSDGVAYPDARIEAAAAYIVSIFERFCGVSFIPREHIEVYGGTESNERGSSIALRQRRPIEVTAMTEDGVAVSPADLVLRGGVVRRYASGSTVAQSWNPGTDNLVVTYDAGYAGVPADIKEAALQATRARLLETVSTSGIDDRRTSLSNEMGTINFVIAGEDRPTGYPVVDAVLLGYKASRAPLVAT